MPGWQPPARIGTRSRYAVATVALIAVSLSVGELSHHAAGPQRYMAPTRREWEVQEWYVQRFLPRGEPLQAIGFGSGGSITTLVQKTPRAIYHFEYFFPSAVTGGLTQSLTAAPGVLQLTTPTDVVGVTSDGIPLYLDASTDTVKTGTISGQRVFVAALDSNAVVQSACATNARTIVFVESPRPDTVFIRSIDHPPARAVALASAFPDGRPTPWSAVRLDGSLGAGCALWAPTWREVVTVTDSTMHPAWRLGWTPGTAPWPKRVISWITGRDLRPGVARDMTVFPGGVGVLSADGEFVDLYSSTRGNYVATMTLPRPALRIAGAGERIFVLSQALDSVLLASYVLPPHARDLAPQVERRNTPEPPPPKWLAALRKAPW